MISPARYKHGACRETSQVLNKNDVREAAIWGATLEKTEGEQFDSNIKKVFLREKGYDASKKI